MDIAALLRGLGLQRYEAAFRDKDIDAALLASLTEADLRELGVVSLGHRKRLFAAIAALVRPADGPRAREQEERAPGPPAAPLPAPEAAERRQLTMLFCDLVGSTALAARLDPEELRGLVAAYHQGAAGVVGRWGGSVAEYMGDGVLAFFGHPRAGEDDAERAVRAGLELVEAVGALVPPSGSAPLQARVGVATGLVVVGRIMGAAGAEERGAVGATPNLAARLQALADVDAMSDAGEGPSARRGYGGRLRAARLRLPELRCRRLITARARRPPSDRSQRKKIPAPRKEACLKGPGCPEGIATTDLQDTSAGQTTGRGAPGRFEGVLRLPGTPAGSPSGEPGAVWVPYVSKRVEEHRTCPRI